MKSDRLMIYFFMFMIMLSAVFAAGEITQTADRINYWTSENHIVTVENTGTETTNVTVTIPSVFSWVSGSGCSNSGSNIYCSLAGSSSGTYTVSSPSGASEYDTDTFVLSTNNTYTGNNVSMINIKDEELFHTLVEYGRGRGNYFFDSAYSTAGSGHTGVGCAYVPNNTLFELNYLHKVLNIRQYFGDLTAIAYNATFSCTYPNRSIVRQHLITSTMKNDSGVYVDYQINKVEGSWERMGYLGMNFRASDQYVGEFLTINCTNISYYLPAAGGNIYVPEDSFTFEVRDREPFTASASASSIVGNGTQEVLITYTITNNEVYSVDDAIIEIEAPDYAAFIGTRAELWGTGLDQYRIEKAKFSANETETVTLVARFDTSSAPNITSVNLTKGIKVKYTTCWEINAYNPSEYIQRIYPAGTASVNMGVSTEIVSIQEQIEKIYNISIRINSTVNQINNTVTRIQMIVDVINATTNETNLIVKQLNITASTILNETNQILNNTIIIANDTSFIVEQLSCTNVSASPLCSKVSVLNQTLQDLLNVTLQLNNTVSNLNITIDNINITDVNLTININFTNLTNQLLEVKEYINCTNVTGQPNTSVCNRIARIENLTIIINNSVNNIYNTTSYWNSTVFGNFSLQNISDAINNISVDTSSVLSALKEVREFDEELVFLVTDSFGLQQEAKVDFMKGDIVSSTEKLVEANSKLMDSMDLMLGEKEKNSLLSFSAVSKITGSLIFLALVIAGVVYLFGKVPEEDYR